MWNIIFGLFYQKQIETTKNPKIEKTEKGMESSVDVNLWNIFKQKFERKLFIEVRFFEGIKVVFKLVPTRWRSEPIKSRLKVC